MTEPGVLSWEELIRIGRNEDDQRFEQSLRFSSKVGQCFFKWWFRSTREQAVNQACMLVYTSGTTGNPKGAMISQDNLTWTVEVMTKSWRGQSWWNIRLRDSSTGGKWTKRNLSPISHSGLTNFCDWKLPSPSFGKIPKSSSILVPLIISHWFSYLRLKRETLSVVI